MGQTCCSNCNGKRDFEFNADSELNNQVHQDTATENTLADISKPLSKLSQDAEIHGPFKYKSPKKIIPNVVKIQSV